MYGHLTKDQAEKVAVVGNNVLEMAILVIQETEPDEKHAEIYDNYTDSQWDAIRLWEQRMVKIFKNVVEDIKFDLDNNNFKTPKKKELESFVHKNGCPDCGENDISYERMDNELACHNCDWDACFNCGERTSKCHCRPVKGLKKLRTS
jgi:ribosomal protein S27E